MLFNIPDFWLRKVMPHVGSAVFGQGSRATFATILASRGQARLLGAWTGSGRAAWSRPGTVLEHSTLSVLLFGHSIL